MEKSDYALLEEDKSRFWMFFLSIITIVLEDTVFDSTRSYYALIHLEGVWEVGPN